MKNGFTLIELMTGIMIISIVIAIGVPSFTVTIQNNRLASQTNTVISALNFVRSEAVKRNNARLTICGSSDQASCNTSNWESGWVIFPDNDNDSQVSAGETILKVDGAMSGGNTLRASGFSSTSLIRFDTQGMLSGSGTFTLCDERGVTEARAIVMNISGQARTAIDEDLPVDSIVNDHDGDNVTCP